MDTIEQRVKRVVARELGVEEAKVLSVHSFAEDLEADSLARVELVLALENEFDITIPDDQADGLQTVQQAINYAREALGSAVTA